MSPGLKRILAIFFRYRWRVALGVVCLLAVDAGQLAIPLLIREVIDRVADATASRAWLGWMGLALVGLAVAIAGLRFAWRHLFFVAAHHAGRELRRQILDHALHLAPGSLAGRTTGEVMALATNDVESVRRALAMGFVAGFDAFVFSLFALAAMFWLAPETTLWVVLPLPLLAVLMRFALRAVYERWDRVQAAFESLTERSRESISGVRVIKAFAQQEGDAQRFGQVNRAIYGHMLDYARVDALFRPLIILLTGSCTAILLGLGGLRAIDQQISLGTFVALTTYLGMLTWPMIAAGWMATMLQRSAASMDRIQTFLHRAREPEPAATSTPIREGRIALRELSFTYPGAREPTLQDISLEVASGGSLGIVGEIGSGKSTLAKLLLRLEDPPPGSLFIDGRDVLDIDRSRVRAAVAWVPQEAFLFSATIADNLRLGDPAAPAADLERVCRLAAVHEEIAALEKGYQTLLGERGLSLSGGQKQRLCLARALLKPAPILLLDDTLSAVDADTEQAIVAGLHRALVGRTAIVISHRTSAVRALDRIAVLRRGRMIQYGPPAALIDQPGYYRRMAELQELECCE